MLSKVNPRVLFSGYYPTIFDRIDTNERMYAAIREQKSTNTLDVHFEKLGDAWRETNVNFVHATDADPFVPVKLAAEGSRTSPVDLVHSTDTIDGTSKKGATDFSYWRATAWVFRGTFGHLLFVGRGF